MNGVDGITLTKAWDYMLTAGGADSSSSQVRMEAALAGQAYAVRRGAASRRRSARYLWSGDHVAGAIYDVLPDPDGWASGNPAWHWETIEKWAWSTGRMPDLRIRILTLLAESPSGGGFATPVTQLLIARGVVGPETRPAKIASVLTDLFEEGYVSIHLRNEWKITDHGYRFLADRMELGQPLVGGSGQPAPKIPHLRLPRHQ